MNIKIAVNGTLHIERPRPGNPMWIEQKCPFASPDVVKLASCGDFCPHFGEPELVTGMSGRWYSLQLCHGKFLQGSITDERAKV